MPSGSMFTFVNLTSGNNANITISLADNATSFICITVGWFLARETVAESEYKWLCKNKIPIDRKEYWIWKICEDKVLLLLSKYIYLLLQNKDPGQSFFELLNHVNEKLLNEKGFWNNNLISNQTWILSSENFFSNWHTCMVRGHKYALCYIFDRLDSLCVSYNVSSSNNYRHIGILQGNLQNCDLTLTWKSDQEGIFFITNLHD